MSQTCCNRIAACQWIGGSPVLMARVTGNLGVPVTQATVASINRTITNKSTGVVVSSDALVVADTIYNTLQTPAAWTYDTTGFNFSDQPPAEDIDEADVTYVVVYTLTMTTGQPIVLDPYDITAKSPV